MLVAGDLLDRRLIDPACLGACLAAMQSLAEVAPVVAVTGNHDDPVAVGAPGAVPGAARDHGDRARARGGAEEAVVTVPTRAGPLHVAALPWLETERLGLAPGAGPAHGPRHLRRRRRRDPRAPRRRAARPARGGRRPRGAPGPPAGQRRRRGRRRARADPGDLLRGDGGVRARRPRLPRARARPPPPAGAARLGSRPLRGQPPGARLLRGQPRQERRARDDRARRHGRSGGGADGRAAAGAHPGAAGGPPPPRRRPRRRLPPLRGGARPRGPGPGAGGARAAARRPARRAALRRAGLGATDETGAADGGEPRTLPEHYQDWHAASGRPFDPRQADAFAAALAAAEPSP